MARRSPSWSTPPAWPRSAPAYGVRWDLAHARALLITNRASGDGPAHDYWLLDFGWSTAP